MLTRGLFVPETGKALLVGLFSKLIPPFSCSFCVLVGAVMSVSMENWLAMETISIDILTAAEASAFFLTCSFVCFFLSTLSPDFFLAVVDRSFCSSFFSFLFSVFFGLVFSFSLVFFFSLVLSTSSFSFRSVFFWGLCSSFWFLTSFFFLGLISLSWILLSFDLAVSILFRFPLLEASLNSRISSTRLPMSRSFDSACLFKIVLFTFVAHLSKYSLLSTKI